MSLVDRLKLPFQFELDHVNVFLVRDGGGWMLVDSGFGTEECFAALEAGLCERGIEWKAIHTLLLTHSHPDHIGLASRILELSGARLIMHRVERAFLSHIAEVVSNPQIMDGQLLAWGTPAELVGKITRAFRGVRDNFRELKPDVELEGGERVGEFEAVWTPGHSPGHVCLYHAAARELICGDHVLRRITPHIAWAEGKDTLAEYLQSLEVAGALDVETVHPSHGDAYTGLAARVAEIKAHHEWRCESIRKAVAAGARTPYELVMALWTRALTPFQHRFAIYEVMAHVEYMRRRGEASV